MSIWKNYHSEGGKMLRIKRWLTMLVAIIMVQTVLQDAAYAATIKIPAGTPITIRLNETVSTKNSSTGQLITALTVVNDIKVNGKVAIAAGSMATAEVTKAEKPGFIGIAGELNLVGQTVRAVDGTMVPFSLNKYVEGRSRVVLSVILGLLCLFPLLIKGGHAEFPTGSTFNGMTLGLAEVTVTD